MTRDWRCPWCGHWNDGELRVSFCGSCYRGRTQAIEDYLADKVGLPRRTLRKDPRP